MKYHLYYWTGIQGRGEFVRLVLEEGGADYIDVARLPKTQGGGDEAIARVLRDNVGRPLPFAPPVLKAGRQMVFHTAAILHYLGPRLGLAPAAEAQRLWAHELQLTLTDFVAEAHDVHHPIAAGLYYEDQKKESLRRAPHFRQERLTKFLGYFESVIQRGGGDYLLGKSCAYVDLSMFQVVASLHYAFPEAMRSLRRRLPRLHALHDRVASRPRVARYLASPARLPFNTQDVMRHYPELDGGTGSSGGTKAT